MVLQRDDAVYFPDTAAPTPEPEPMPDAGPVPILSPTGLAQLAGMVAAYFENLLETKSFNRSEAERLAQSFQAAVVASLAMAAPEEVDDAGPATAE